MTLGARAFRLDVEGPYDLSASLAGLRFGARDPSARFDRTTALKAAHTPEGPVTLRVQMSHVGTLDVELHGPGTRWTEERIRRILGLDDVRWAPRHRGLARAASRKRGGRLGCVISLGELHVATILQQRVRWIEAAAAWARVTQKRRLAAPGTDRVLLPLAPSDWRRVPSYELAAMGVELKRYQALQIAVRAAPHVEAAWGDAARLRPLLMSLRGTGVWTTEMVLGWGAADADAVPLGDVHLPHAVSKFFEGVPHGSDERMVELLEPFRGNRFRVLRWIAG